MLQLVLIPSCTLSLPSLWSSFWFITSTSTRDSNLEMDWFKANIVSSAFPPSLGWRTWLLFPPPSEGRTGLGRCICHPTVEKRKHTNRIFSGLWLKKKSINFCCLLLVACWSQSIFKKAGENCVKESLHLINYGDCMLKVTHLAQSWAHPFISGKCQWKSANGFVWYCISIVWYIENLCIWSSEGLYKFTIFIIFFQKVKAYIASSPLGRGDIISVIIITPDRCIPM